MRLSVLLFGLALTACGSAKAPAPAVAPVATVKAEKVAEPPPAARRPVAAYTLIDYEWVARHLSVEPAAMERWSIAHPDAVRPDMRHVLVKVPEGATPAQEAAAKKKATNILAQAKKGADFAKLARTYSEDPGSKEKGGAYSGEMVSSFVTEIRDAYAALAPGEVDKQLVRTAFGWHVLKKDKPTAANVELAYRTHQTMSVTRQLADQLADRLESRAPIGSLEKAIRATLGDAAVADARQLTKGVVSPNDYRAGAKMSDACAHILDVPENDVQLVAARTGILVVRGDEGVPGKDTAEICPPIDVELASTEPVDTSPLLAVLTRPLPRE